MTVRLRRAACILVSLVTAASATLVAPTTASAVGEPVAHPRTIGPSSGTVRYAVDEPVCAVPKNPHVNRCYAVERVPATRSTPGAYAYTVPDVIAPGPAGGYTADDIAKAYGVDPATPRPNQTVALVDWYDDPHALSDLNFFDSYYGLRTETATSFRKVNQNGHTTSLPRANRATSGEIALDIESVRGMCHSCRILLIEANNGSDANLAIAENLAVRMGATEVSNSFGEPEYAVSKAVQTAYNHPGVVITAATGDDGWNSWDHANDKGGTSSNAASFPSTSPYVVAVGGTTLRLNNDGTRYAEGVWNENGPDDRYGVAGGRHQGAGGGGCSTLYTAPSWQAAHPGYSAAGCNGKRLAADISADADSATGLDVYLTYGGSGWETIGGTSLAAPLVAAMFALAGGSHGAAYPASTLYTNADVRQPSIFDIVDGGNGFCAGTDTLDCGDTAHQLNASTGSYNPNDLVVVKGVHSEIECSFPASGDVATSPTLSSQCNAAPGYDGPSGLGTPNDLGAFAQTNANVTISHTTLFRLRRSLTFTASSEQVLAGTKPTRYLWNWGDGTTTTTTAATTHHTYTEAGAHTVTLTETDNRHTSVVRSFGTSVGRAPTAHYVIPASARARRAATFGASATALNTGARISRITWRFGDGHTSTSAHTSHAYTHAGTFAVVLTVTDTSGVSTTVRKNVRVRG